MRANGWMIRLDEALSVVGVLSVQEGYSATECGSAWCGADHLMSSCSRQNDWLVLLLTTPHLTVSSFREVPNLTSTSLGL